MEVVISILGLLVAYGLYRLLKRSKWNPEPVKQRDSAASQSVATASVSEPIKWQSTVKADKSRESPRWIAPGDTVTVAGRRIGGMIYLGRSARRESLRGEGKAFIDAGLSVAKLGTDIPGETLPYWPNYSDISPQSRATYLDWLASGRADKQYGAGYVFLYFYGLERRFFVDSPAEDEKRLLIAEVDRLLGTYGENRSIRRYLGNFLDTGQIVVESVRRVGPLHFQKRRYELPLGLLISIGRMAKEEVPLSADWLLSWYISHPEHQLRTPATRAFLEFRSLFALLYYDRFPEGLTIRAPKKLLRARYTATAASGEFEIDLNQFLGEIPDIANLSQPLSIASEIVEEATVALDKYSRFLGRNPEGRETIEAHALLPERLWPLFPCEKMEEIRGWSEGIIESGGLAPVEQVIERLEGALPDKISKRQLTGVADALARLATGVAPDPRFALRSPKLGEPVVLFRLPGEIAELEQVSDKYRQILTIVALGSFVAHSDGTIAQKERSLLATRIDDSGLSAAERARLHANLQWMLEVPPDLGVFRQGLQNFPEDVRHELGQVALAMAAADGVVDPEEIRAIERLYKVMDLTREGVFSDLHALAAPDEPVSVRPAAEQNRDFAVPPPPGPDTKMVLDTERVASVMANTARVASVLGDIFGEDETKDEREETLEGTGGGFSGLDSQHAAFLGEMLTRTHWDKVDFAALAGQFRLMQEGALETVNEWSFERFGDVLIEEHEGYEINLVVMEQLRE